MRDRSQPITTIEELLEALAIEYGSRKYAAEVRRFDPMKPQVIEYFDDGKGHSGAFSSQTSPLDLKVFQEALDKRYITGKLEPGYVSKIEFKLTELGEQVHLARLRGLHDAARAAADKKAADEHIPEANND